MKLLLLPLLLLAGAGGYGLAASPTDDAAPVACDAADCRITVECTDRGTCIVTCFDENGDVRCQQEVACDGPCDQASEKACDKPCTPGKSCTR